MGGSLHRESSIKLGNSSLPGGNIGGIKGIAGSCQVLRANSQGSKVRTRSTEGVE